MMLKHRSLRMFKRCFSNLRISEELRQALSEKKPIVSLESTIITHGLPYPQNIEMAQRVEKEIRKYGAIPATTAFIQGIPKVGLNESELEMLANSSNATKVSRRDIPYVLSQKLNGGTTISGTMILSEKAGIKVFATGGLGGVHRDGENSMDISADLDELGRTPVAVVCAGPKSILDIERTMEYLETKGVFVGTWGPEGTNIPGFYTRDSGVRSTYNFQDYSTAANIIKQGEMFGLRSGMVFCIPPPEEIAMDNEFIGSIIEQANYDAVKLGVKGKQITPFMLSRIAEATKGASVKTNVEFVLNNARAATRIAIEYAKLDGDVLSKAESYQIKPTKKEEKAKNKPVETSHQFTDSIVVGSIALDSACLSKSEVVLNDSNPVNIKSSIGGVGYNVALESIKSGNDRLKFISTVGADVQGSKIIEDIEITNHSIEIQNDKSTSQYISFHDAKGDLVIAAANMDVIESISDQHILNEIKSSNPKIVLMDGNISPKTMGKIIESSRDLKFPIIFEPTSAPKSTRLSEVSNLKIWPDSSISLCTPTLTELQYMYESFENNGKFELDHWFPVIDSLGVDKSLRLKLESAALRNPSYKKIISKGLLQAGVSLLPYIKTLVIKDGANGVYLLSIHKEMNEIKVNPKCELSITSASRGIGVLFEHYSAPCVLENLENVTGAGDALAGFLLTALSRNPDVLSNDDRGEVIEAAQKAASRKLLSSINN